MPSATFNPVGSSVGNSSTEGAMATSPLPALLNASTYVYQRTDVMKKRRKKAKRVQDSSTNGSTPVTMKKNTNSYTKMEVHLTLMD
jgi:hypothetical protein